MKQNMGTFDRIARILFACVFALLYFKHLVNGWLGIGLLVIACIFGITAIIGNCPLYKLVGINTCHRKKAA